MVNSQLKNSNNKKFMQQKKKKKASSSKRKTVDEITRVVRSFSTSEKREILSQMKLLIEQNEKGAKEILLENPQLAQALLLIQMEFNLVKTQDINALTQNVSNKQIVTPKNTPKHTPKNTPKKNINTNANSTNNEQQDVEMSEPDNKVNENRLKGLSNSQQTVLGRVMKMSPEEIAKLPIHVQNQVRAVQAQLAKRSMQK